MFGFKFILVLGLAVSIAGCMWPSQAEHTLQQGITFLNRGEHQEAITMFRVALEYDPEVSDAQYYLGICYLETYKLEKARKEWEVAARTTPRHQDCLYQLGCLCEELQDPEAAERHYRKASALNGKRTREAMIRRAVVLERLHHTYEAIELLRAVAVKGRDSSLSGEAWARLGLVYRRLGKTRLADECISAAGGKHKGALFLFNKALSFIFSHKHIAIEALNGAINLDPSWEEAYISLSFAYISSGESERAIDVTQQLFKVHPHSIAGHVNAAVAYRNIGKIDKAMGTYQKMLNFGKDFQKSDAFYELGYLAVVVGDRDKSKEWFSKAISFNPGSKRAVACMEQASTLSGFRGLREAVIEELNGNPATRAVVSGREPGF